MGLPNVKRGAAKRRLQGCCCSFARRVSQIAGERRSAGTKGIASTQKPTSHFPGFGRELSTGGGGPADPAPANVPKKGNSV